MKNLNRYFKTIPNFFSARSLNDIDSVNNFLSPPKKWINNPFLFYSMDKAVDKIIDNPKNKPILVHGDCDADGVSACAVLYTYLTQIGYNVHSYIPNRSLEGHIMSKKAIDFAHSIGCHLIITCDLGMGSHLEVDYANSKLIDVIITDHHKIGISAPNAYAIINPWLDENKNLPFRDYSGSGVAFKLCHAINEKLSLKEDFINNLMGCAAIGTISDKVTIDNENRYISFYGYNQIKSGNNLGLSLLNNSISRNKAKLNMNKIIQIINMATKLEDPSIGVKLLTTNNPVQANNYANKILGTYDKNKIIFSNAIESAIRQAHSQNYKKNKSIFIISDYDSAYNGAIASRLALKFNVPCAVLSKMNDSDFKGSCRSVVGVDILSLINLNSDMFLNLGGHPMAAGFTIKNQNVNQFKTIFTDFMIDKDIITKEKKDIIDGEISFCDIDSEMIRFLENFKPYSRSNHIPRFKTNNVNLIGKPGLFGADNSSIRFKLEHNKVKFNAIGFNLINQFEILLSKNKLDIEYSILINNNKVSLKVYDIS
jgi:single-stranded-DNA-specific exonuclease